MPPVARAGLRDELAQRSARAGETSSISLRRGPRGSPRPDAARARTGRATVQASRNVVGRGAGDDQRRDRLVDQDAVRLVDDGRVDAPHDQPRFDLGLRCRGAPAIWRRSVVLQTPQPETVPQEIGDDLLAGRVHDVRAVASRRASRSIGPGHKPRDSPQKRYRGPIQRESRSAR